jgi:hypothetical protein
MSDHLARRYRLERDFLAALAAATDGIATIDDATEKEALASAYSDSGKWVGPVIRELADQGIIQPVRDTTGRRCVKTSTRRSRKSGHVTFWLLTDRNAEARRRAALNTLLAALPDEPRQRNLFDD